MKITIINTSDISGGAAKAAYRLHKGLRAAGHSSFMLVKNMLLAEEHVCSVKTGGSETISAAADLLQMELINKNRTELSNTLFSLPYPGIDLSEFDMVSSADIINLHWVSHFQSTETISKLLMLGKPVVWTLHDMWPFTGGCHYSSGCEKYTAGCFDCPQLHSNKYQVPFHVLKNKLKYFNKHLTVVCPSKWLAGCAAKSNLFKNCRIEVIPNSLEANIFKPFSKERAKSRSGIPSDTIVLLFGAIAPLEKRKGFSELLGAIDICLKNSKFNTLVREDKIRIAVFGKAPAELEKSHIQIVCHGMIDDDSKLAELYSAADIFVLPSLEDNLPNTMLESMACGTPVVAFQTGGISDIIINGKNGWMSDCGNKEELANKIIDLVIDEEKRRKMSESCRVVIENGFSLEHQANNYAELFSELLKQNKTAAREHNSKTCFQQNSILKQNMSEKIDPYFLKTYNRLNIKRKFFLLVKMPLRFSKRIIDFFKTKT